MRKSRKLIAILATLALLVTLIVPATTPAFAAGTISALSVPSIGDDDTAHYRLGTVKVTIPAGSVKADDTVMVKLPDGYDFWEGSLPVPPALYEVYDENTIPAAAGNYVVVPTVINASGDLNGLQAGDIAARVADIEDEIEIKANADQSLVGDFIFYIYFGDINVEQGTNKNCEVTFDASTDSGFPSGTVLIGKSTSDGKVILAVTGADTSSTDFDFDVRAKEETPGSLKVDNKSLKFKLPKGYTWSYPVGLIGRVHYDHLWGQDIWIDLYLSSDKRELTGAFVGADLNGNGDLDSDEIGRETTVASAWDWKNWQFSADGSSDCKPGDVMVYVSGKTETNASGAEAPVGTYGEFGAVISAKSTPDIISGQDEQEIGDIVIKENIEGTLVAGRTVTLTLPDNAKWQEVYIAEVKNDDIDDLDNFKRSKGVQLNFKTYVGDRNQTARFEVAGTSTDAAELKLEDIEVATEAGFEGDLVIKVGGTAGITGDLVVAKVKSPFSISASATPDIIIGKAGQPAGDVTITENIKEAFIDGKSVALTLPTDVEFDGTPTVKVTEGNLSINNVRRSANNSAVLFNIEGESTIPSTVTVTGIKLKLYRTVPEGDISLKVRGLGAVETSEHDDWTNSDYAAKASIGKCITPAPTDKASGKVEFTINDTTFKVDGVEKTMDVAPYIKDGRTFLPVRYVATACGVTDENILFSDGKVTLIKGDKVVQLAIGSNVMIINGVGITMDVPAEISSDRTMLPFRWIAQAFGATVTWDETTQTVIMEL